MLTVDKTLAQRDNQTKSYEIHESREHVVIFLLLSTVHDSVGHCIRRSVQWSKSFQPRVQPCGRGDWIDLS